VDRKCTILPIALAGTLALSLLQGCSAQTQNWLLTTFFDIPDTRPPPTRRVRRDLLREIEELKRELAETRAAAKAIKEQAPAERAMPPIERAKSWEEAFALLPRDNAGKTDWVQGLKAGTIVPRPGLDPKAPDQAVLELDVELASAKSQIFSAVFPHAGHTQWLACRNCHPSIFPIGRGAQAATITMTKIQAGQYCGVCHGRVAFSIEGECSRCHTRVPAITKWQATEEPKNPVEQARSWEEAAKLLPVTAGTTDWVKAVNEKIIAPRPGIDPKAPDQPVLPITIERTPPGQPPFRAIFPHDAHTQWLSCPNCHTAIFQMARGATPINMGLIYAGQACGACHGKVAFPATACGRCHPAMAGGT
jgi:c(7)-type cytochrome triheme protein